MQGSLIGVGPALRKAQLSRRKTLDEASRDTRIRAEYLEALERETFSELGGEVYVRASLRTYATYLGLSAEKVAAAYVRAAPDPTSVEVPAPPKPAASASAPVIRRGRHGVAFGVAGTLLVAAIAFGLLSRADPTPAPVAPSPEAVDAPCSTTGVTVALTANEPVGARVLADGEHVFNGRLHTGETKTFLGDDALTVRLSRGGAAAVSVDCASLGLPAVGADVHRSRRRKRSRSWRRDRRCAVDTRVKPLGLGWPNVVSILRALLVPVIVLLILTEDRHTLELAALLFVAGALTDGLDGYLARRHGMTTRTGQWLDPLSDKLFVSAPMVTLALLDRFPAWAAVVIVAREIAVSGLRAYLGSRRASMPASSVAKWKTASQIVAVTLYLLPLTGSAADVRFVVLCVSVALTVYSGVDYFLSARRRAATPA
jgi:CDP-diacylglycerol--glycerol-3-phosphate 3-phosphatidyltransferase